jgi:hypothetical protein
MELHEFIEKFLPDYDISSLSFRAGYFPDSPIAWEKYGSTLFCTLMFPKALQSFTDRICEKQIKKCAYSIKEALEEYECLYAKNTERVKIDEL